MRAIGRLLPRPHAVAVSPLLFCKEGDNRIPAIPRREHTDRNRKMAKNRTAPISGRGFCRVDVERGHLSDPLQIGREEGQVAAGVLCTRETV